MQVHRCADARAHRNSHRHTGSKLGPLPPSTCQHMDTQTLATIVVASGRPLVLLPPFFCLESATASPPTLPPDSSQPPMLRCTSPSAATFTGARTFFGNRRVAGRAYQPLHDPVSPIIARGRAPRFHMTTSAGHGCFRMFAHDGTGDVCVELRRDVGSLASQPAVYHTQSPADLVWLGWASRQTCSRQAVFCRCADSGRHLVSVASPRCGLSIAGVLQGRSHACAL